LLPKKETREASLFLSGDYLAIAGGM